MLAHIRVKEDSHRPRMLELVTTFCTVATLAVLVAAATAAVAQLRHVRAGNQLQAVLAIERSFADAPLQRAFVYVHDELAGRLQSPQYRAELVARGYIDPLVHPEMAVCNWFEDAGTIIAGGFVDEELFFDSFGRLVDAYWVLLTPVIALLRRERGPEQYARFEFLAYRAQRWTERNAKPAHPRAGAMAS